MSGALHPSPLPGPPPQGGRESFDAVIIGGGPAGATAAILLARAGWSVAVVEKATFPRRKVCGEFVSASNAALLRELGIEEAFRDLAGPEVRRVGLFARDADLTSAMPRGEDGRGWGRALGRETLDRLLLERAAAAGATIFQPWSAAALAREGDVFACRIVAKDAEQTLLAPIAIAAHGSWEPGTLPTQAKRAHGASDLLAFKAHFFGSELPTDTMPLLAFPGGYGGMASTDGGRVSLSCCIRRDQLKICRERHAGSNAGESVLAHIADSCAGVRRVLAPARIDGVWLAAGPIAPGIRPRYADGIFRVGNAAGEAHPIVAEGISMAMQSAWLLARALTEQKSSIGSAAGLDEAGRIYSAAWRSRFATRIHAASIFATLAMQSISGVVLLPIVSRFPSILTFGAALSGKVKALDPVRP